MAYRLQADFQADIMISNKQTLRGRRGQPNRVQIEIGFGTVANTKRVTWENPAADRPRRTSGASANAAVKKLEAAGVQQKDAA